MFAVPEVDDDTADSSPSVENKKLPTDLEGTPDTIISSPPPPTPPPSASSTTAAATTENDEKTSVKTEDSPSLSGKQHLSRLSNFQRNTIHICDQISDHV